MTDLDDLYRQAQTKAGYLMFDKKAVASMSSIIRTAFGNFNPWLIKCRSRWWIDVENSNVIMLILICHILEQKSG